MIETTSTGRSASTSGERFAQTSHFEVTFANGAWGDNVTQENGDVCNFYFGATKLATNGSHYNDSINGKHYLMQQMARVSPPTPAKVGNYTGTCVGYMK